MNKKRIERIATIGLAAFLVGYFCYQVVYGMSMVMGPNGTMAITQGNVSATLRAPPGSVIKNITIVPEQGVQSPPGSTVSNSLAIDPKDKDALYSKGNNIFSLGNYTGAILYYDKTLATDPKDVHALTNKGVSLYHIGNYTGAIEYLDGALAINPKHENALYNKGLVLHTLGNDTER